MLSDDDHPGLFTFMVGIIIVVLAAVALSLLVDKKFSFSRSANVLESGIQTSALEIERLKARVRECSRELAEREPKRRLAATNHESVQRQVETANHRRTLLSESRKSLLKAIPVIEEEFSRYRAKYREQTWRAAVGQSLGTLTVRSGREYRQVVISQVTDVGLEIRHEDGIARLQAPDLDRALQDRFQWNDGERRARLNEEHAVSEATTRSPDAVKQQEVRPVKSLRPSREEVVPREKANPDAAKIEILRGKVIGWKSKISRLASDRREAQSAASYGSQSSVPGSLETWQARAARHGAELAKARAEHAAAKAALAAASPNDPLLQPDPSAE